MISRPDWNLPATPAVPSIEETSAAMERGLPPTPAQQSAFGVEPTAPPAVPAKWDGKTRPDWNTAPVAVNRKSFSGLPDWDQPRNESGQFVSKTEGEMRAQWDREGGIDQVAKIVMQKEQVMYSVSPTLEAKVTEHLDKAFLTKAADHLRLGVSYGPTGFWDSVARFEDSLSPSERDAWARFCRSLDADEQAALLHGISK